MNALSLKQVCIKLGRKPKWAYKEINEGRLKAQKIGTEYIVEIPDFLEYCRVWRGAMC